MNKRRNSGNNGNNGNNDHIVAQEIEFNNPVFNNSQEIRDDYDIKEYMRNPDDLFKFLKEYSNLYRSSYIIEEFKKKASTVKYNGRNIKKKASKSSSVLNFFTTDYAKKMVEQCNKIQISLTGLFDKYFDLTDKSKKLYNANINSVVKPYVILTKKQEIINKLITEYIYRLINKITSSSINDISKMTNKVKTIKSVNRNNLLFLRLICKQLSNLQKEYQFMHRDLKINDIKLLGEQIIFNVSIRSSIVYNRIHIFCWKLADIRDFITSGEKKLLHYEDFDPRFDINYLLKYGISNMLKTNLEKNGKLNYTPNTLIREINSLNKETFNLNTIYKNSPSNKYLKKKNNPLRETINLPPNNGVTTFNPILLHKESLSTNNILNNTLKEALL
jgi:hypothetical protein